MANSWRSPVRPTPLWKSHLSSHSKSLTNLTSSSSSFTPHSQYLKGIKLSSSQSNLFRPTNQLPSRQSSASSLSSSQRSIECVNGCVECGKLKQKLNDLEIERKEWMKEKRSFQRKISEFEEELKSFDLIKQENLKLKDENCALIRVISKLSK